MRFVHRKSFTKGIEKLTPNQKKRVGTAIKLFEKNPHHPLLFDNSSVKL